MSRRILLVAFAGCVALQAVRYGLTRSLVAGDSAWYYSTARSLLIDHDLDIANEYEHFAHDVSPRSGNARITEVAEPDPHSGRIPNGYAIGTSLAVLPFMAAIRPLAGGDGFGPAYMLAAGIGSAALAFAGLLLLYWFGRERYGIERAFLGTLTIWLATPLVYYMTIEPLMSHAVSMFATTSLLVLWLKWRDDLRPVRWAALGLIAGFAGAVRYQDALFALIPVLDGLISGSWRRARTLAGVGCFVLAALLGVSPQLWANAFYRGSIWATGYPSVDDFHWLSPAIGTVLFSLHSGLFTYAPVTLLSLLGLYWLIHSSPATGWLLAGALLVQVYLVSAWLVPEQGAAFGNRMLLSCSPIFAVGLMAVLDQRRFRAVCYALIVLNAVVAGLYCARVIHDPFIATM